uniref:Pseudouridylate synthase 1 homolog n=1 Tax=Phlebotomus papatasi TaxID=29031 RepID=A0A1B0D9A1_PHLPP
MLRLLLRQNRVVLSEVRSCGSFAQIMSEAIDNRKAEVGTKRTKDMSYKSRYEGSKKRREWKGAIEVSQEKKEGSEPFVRIKRKKSVILLGYSGKDYYGMQRNPDVKTVEQELLAAMLKNNWITEEAYNFPQSIGFQRAARTDKGVSAVRQCVSLKLPLDLNIQSLNADLPSQIRVFAVKTVTQGFNSKNDCMARTYTYTLPTIALSSDSSSESPMEKFRIPSEVLDKFREILKMFQGTKNYHNFTTKKAYLDPSSNRYIISFTCQDPFVVEDVEFVELRVKGQSFMMHQIRKMVGLALAIIRGHQDVKLLENAFTQTRLNIPRAPGLGLVLDTLHYDRYNRRYGSDGIHTPLTWEEVEEEIQKFVKKEIHPVITGTEIAEKPTLDWLENKLSTHDFTDQVGEDNDSNDEDEDQEEKPAENSAQELISKEDVTLKTE